jgi:hypothetical protein
VAMNFPELFYLQGLKKDMQPDCSKIQGDSKLLSVFPWPIIFKPEIIEQNC